MKISDIFMLKTFILVISLISCGLYCIALTRDFPIVKRVSPPSNPYIGEMFFENPHLRTAYSSGGWFPTSSKKLFLYIVEGLRYDQVTNVAQNKQCKEENFPEKHCEQGYSAGIFDALVQKVNIQSEKSVLLKGQLETQATTRTRIKALSTGMIPSYFSLFGQLSFQGNQPDNLFEQLKAYLPEKQEIILYGVDLWLKYFSTNFTNARVNDNSNLQSIVDSQESITKEIQERFLPSSNSTNNDWTFFINHDAAIDSLMHEELIYSSSQPFMSPLFVQTVKKSSQYATQIVNSIDQDTTFLLISDHGFSNFGTHGGHTNEELTSVIFGYDKRGFLKTKDISQKMDNSFLNSTTDQIDLLATICMLKGIAIPSNNLGVIIPDFFLTDDENFIANAYFSNLCQISDIIEDVRQINHLNDQSFVEFKDAVSAARQTYKRIFSGAVKDLKNLKEFIQSVQGVSKLAKQISRTQRAPRTGVMSIQLVVIALAVVSLISLTTLNEKRELQIDNVIDDLSQTRRLTFVRRFTETHLRDSIVFKFLVGFFYLHLIVFFLVSTIDTLLLISAGLVILIGIIALDTLVAAFSNYKLQKSKQTLPRRILLISTLIFASSFIASNFTYHLAFLGFVSTSLAFIIIGIQLLVRKHNIKSLAGVVIAIVSSYVSIHIDPFYIRDSIKFSQSPYVCQTFAIFIQENLTIIGEMTFAVLLIYLFKQSYQYLSGISKLRRIISSYLLLLNLAVVLVYFTMKASYSESSQPLSSLKNCFPLASYAILTITFLTLRTTQLTFLRKLQFCLIQSIPSFSYLTDKQGLILIPLLLLIFRCLADSMKILEYSSSSKKMILAGLSTILAFQFFYASGHQLAFEFMHLHTHSIGLIKYSYFFSNINVYLSNFFWFIISNTSTLFFYSFEPAKLQSDRIVRNLPAKDTSSKQTLDDSAVSDEISQLSREEINESPLGSQEIINESFESLEFENSAVRVSQRIALQEPAEVREKRNQKTDIQLSNSQLYICIPTLSAIFTSFLRNLQFSSSDGYHIIEEQSTKIIFLAIILTISLSLFIFLDAIKSTGRLYEPALQKNIKVN